MASYEAQQQSDCDSNQNTMVCRVQMWLDSRSVLTSVMKSLADPAIQFLDLYIRESFLTGFPPDEVRRVMKKIAELPQLERLDISCPYTTVEPNNNPQTYLPVSAIQLAFTRQLTHLLLVNVKLGGTRSDFEAFAKATQSLPQLHCVVLAEIRLSKTSPSRSKKVSYSLMDPFLRSLAQMPELGHILISGSEDLGVLQPSTLALSMKHLRDLCLSQMSLSTPHLQALEQNPLDNLRELDLQCHLTVDGARALANLLQNNETLEELSLRLTTSPQSFSATPRTTAALAVLTMQAAGEEDNSNAAMARDQEEDAEPMDDLYPKQSMEYQRNLVLAGGIVQSKKLNSFELESANLSTPTLLEPFVHMLHDNYSLQAVRLQCSVQKSSCLEKEIAFYTRLNQLGRGHLFQCPNCSHSDQSYLKMLESLKSDDDLSAYYYFIRTKPSLLARSVVGNSSMAPTQRSVLGKRKRLYRAVKYNGVSYKT